MMHETTFDYLKPTEAQLAKMTAFRKAFSDLAQEIGDAVPESRYRSLTLTSLEEAAMWINKAITRHGDGKPRE
jgi:hypothetical protein